MLKYGSSQSGNFPQSYEVTHICEVYTHTHNIGTYKAVSFPYRALNPFVLGLGKENKGSHIINQYKGSKSICC